MGVPGGCKDPGMLAAVEHFLAAARKAGKPASTPAADPGEARALHA
jgi:hypothetical protein